MSEEPDAVALAEVSRSARIEIVKAIAHAKGGHLGGPFSAIDILCLLYFHEMNIDPSRPDMADRDRFILSKGHSSIALYTTLALRGYFDVSELDSFDSLGSRLPGHPDMTVLDGIDMSTGSLGLGFSAATGIALGARLQGRAFTTYVMLGDGECNEGIVWEAAHVASQLELGNLVAIVDQNDLQQHGRLGSDGQRVPPYGRTELADRWRSFGWEVFEADGHDVTDLHQAFARARLSPSRPSVIVAHTVKGKGVSFMENKPEWHSRIPTPEELTIALKELGA